MVAPDSRRSAGYASSPFLVVWETTQACDLACRHCRAEAQPCRHPDELTTAEARRLLEDARRFGPIVFVFSGGDALQRPDIEELVAYGAQLGLRMALTPAATPRCSTRRIHALKEAGLTRLAVSLDGSRASVHDAFRGVAGSFYHGLRILTTAREIGLSTQVNSVVARHDLDDFRAMAALFGSLGIVLWEVFFLVPVGRARADDVAGAEAFERVFHQLYDLSRDAPFDIKATAAPHYTRVVLQRQVAERRAGRRAPAPDVLVGGARHSARDGIGRGRAVNDGDGFVFVSHTGEIFPSGFLPISAGNVRRDDLVAVYRDADLFRRLRDKSLLQGKCGLCDYAPVCGGSRARAYAVSGDALAAEPSCAYRPRRWREGDGSARAAASHAPPAQRGLALPVLASPR
jgi:radical SAM protein